MISIVACCHIVTHLPLGLPIATKWCCNQDVKMVPGANFTKRICDGYSSLQKGGDVVVNFQLGLRRKYDSLRKGW